MPDASALAVGTDDGAVLLWDLRLLKAGTEVEPMLGIACSQAKRNFTQSEWLQYFANEPYRLTCQVSG